MALGLMLLGGGWNKLLMFIGKYAKALKIIELVMVQTHTNSRQPLGDTPLEWVRENMEQRFQREREEKMHQLA